MEFRNLTAFQALTYGAFNVHDEEHHVVALRVAYALVAFEERGEGLGGVPITHRCETLPGDDAGDPCTADAYEAGANASSVKAESDLAPYKPKCDVIVRATAHAPRGLAAERWQVRVRVTAPSDAGGDVQVDKVLDVHGPRWFERAAGGWALTAPTPVAEVPVRWEAAFGGRSAVPHPEARGVEGDPPALLDEVCFTNPVGRGWVEARHFEALERAGRPMPERIAAPQVEDPRNPLYAPVIARNPPGAVEAPEMARAAADYGATPAGLGWVGRAWTPRLQRAGTYDDAWLRERHPFLPADFSFAYWNGAPDDQQIPHPPLGLQFELWNLCAPEHGFEGYLSFALPPHRAFVMAILGGLPLPVPAEIDTVVVDAEAMKVVCVWRVLVPRALGVTAIEARFEVDPDAALLKIEEG